MTDQQLLAHFTEDGDQAAFAELVHRHVDWICSMATRLAHGDRAIAEDVTQAVFILLAKKAHSLRRESSLSNWLFVVTRYCMNNALRNERCRKHREQEAAAMRHEASAPPAQWDELAPLLDELVAQLRRGDRQAVLLRFYQSKTFPEIGAALSVSEEAARKRVSRSIEQLRTAFSRRGIRVGASALAVAMSANLTQPASAAVIAGASAASVSTASPALVHATSAMLTWAGIKPLAAAIVVVLTLTTVAAVTLLQTAPMAQSIAPPSSAPATAPQLQARYGRIITQDDAPVAAARVWQIEYSPQLDRYRVVASTTADGEGRFQLPIIGEEARLVVRATGFAWAGGTLRSTASDDPDEVRVVAGTALRVKLVDPDGKPAAGVSVQLTEALMPFRRIWNTFPADLQEPGIVQTSNADGVCVFNDLPQGGKAYVEVADERFVRRDILHYQGLELAYADQSDGGVIQLRPAASISGTVAIEDSAAPVKGIRVEARTQLNGWGRAMTDEQGRYELKQLPPGSYKISLSLGYELNSRYAAKPIDRLNVAAGMHLDHQDFSLIAGGIIRGKITKQDNGQPLKGIDLYAESSGFVSAKSDADGIYVVHVPPGKQHVALFTPPAGLTLTRPASYDVTVDDGKTVEVNFQLASSNATPVTGRVVDAAGRPISGAEIHIQKPGYEGAGNMVTSTDSAGNFSIATVDASSQLRARKGKMTTLNPTSASEQNLTLMLHRNAQGAIHVVVAQEDSQPLAGARVKLTDTLGNDTYDEKLTGPDGSCLFRGVDPDMTYRIKTWGAGYGTAQANVQVQPGKQTDVPPFRLRRADSTLSGIVLDEAGNPRADIKVTMMSRYWATEMRTDIAGRFNFKGLVAGERASLSAEDSDRSLNGEIRNATVPGNDLIITLQPRWPRTP